LFDCERFQMEISTSGMFSQSASSCQRVILCVCKNYMYVCYVRMDDVCTRAYIYVLHICHSTM
jgi:hypothetical protein